MTILADVSDKLPSLLEMLLFGLVPCAIVIVPYLALRLRGWPLRLLAYLGAVVLLFVTIQVSPFEDSMILDAIRAEQGELAYFVHATWLWWPIASVLVAEGALLLVAAAGLGVATRSRS